MEFELWQLIIAIPAGLAALLGLPAIVRKYYVEARKASLEVKELQERLQERDQALHISNEKNQQLKSGFENLVQVTEAIAPFRYESFHTSYDLADDGRFTIRRQGRVIVKTGSLGEIDHGNWLFGGRRFEAYERSITGIAKGSEVLERVILDEPGAKRFSVLFDPPLTDYASYKVIESTFNAAPISREEVEKFVDTGHWPWRIPFACHSYRCRYPTGLIEMSTSFPETYRIEDANWTCTFGYTSAIDEEEYANLVTSNRVNFNYRVLDGRRVITLTLEKPKVGRTYWLRWLPPRLRDTNIPTTVFDSET